VVAWDFFTINSTSCFFFQAQKKHVLTMADLLQERCEMDGGALFYNLLLYLEWGGQRSKSLAVKLLPNEQLKEKPWLFRFCRG